MNKKTLIFKEASRVFSTREQARVIRQEALAILEQANEFSTASRRVSKRAAYKVISRSLYETRNLPFSIRKHRAISELSNYIALAKYNKVNGLVAFNTDLLPVSHPKSTKITTMTASAVLKAQMFWVVDDPRITDELAKTLIASAMMSHPDSPEHMYTMKRIELLPQGTVPLEALVAAYGDGNSRAAKSARARLQRRDRKGRFAEMFGTFKLLFGLRDGGKASATGRILGQNIFSPDLLDMELSDGRIASVPISQGEQPEAFLDDNSDEARRSGYVRTSDLDTDPNAPVIPEDNIVFIDAPSGFREDKDYRGPGKKYTDEAFDVTVFDKPSPQTRDVIDDAIKRRRELDLEDPRQNKKGEDGKLWDPDRKLFAVNKRGQKTPFAFAQSWNDSLSEISRQEKFDTDQEQFQQGEEEENVPLSDQLKGSPKKAKAKKKTEKPKAEIEAEGFKYNVPNRSIELDPNFNYIPEGSQDDPSMLAAVYDAEELQDALVDALEPVSSTGPATGLGRLEDENGDEFEVPAEAIVSAINEQGGDTEMSLAKAYDALNGNDDNKKALEKARLDGRKERAAEPKELDEVFDEVVSAEPETPAEDAVPAEEVDEITPDEERQDILDSLDRIANISGLTKEEKESIVDKDLDYSPFIPKNEDIDVPEGMYKPQESSAEDREQALSLASHSSEMWSDADLMNGLSEAMKNGGTNNVLSLDENREFVPKPVSAESWRDAIALRGQDPNRVIKAIADGTLDIAKEAKEAKSREKKRYAEAKKDREKKRKDLLKKLGLSEDPGKEKRYQREVLSPLDTARWMLSDRYDSELDGLAEAFKSFLDGRDLDNLSDAKEVLRDFKESVDAVTFREGDELFADILDSVKRRINEDLESLDEYDNIDEETQDEIKEEEKQGGLPAVLPQGWSEVEDAENLIKNEETNDIIGFQDREGVEPHWFIATDAGESPEFATAQEALDYWDANFKDVERVYPEGTPAEGSEEPESIASLPEEGDLPPTEPPTDEPEEDEQPPKKIITYKRAGKRTLLRAGKGGAFKDKDIADFLIENGFEWSGTIERDGKTINVMAQTKLQDDEEFKEFARELRDRFDIDLQPRAGQEPIDIDAPAPTPEPVEEPTPEVVEEPTPTEEPETKPTPEEVPETEEEPEIEEVVDSDRYDNSDENASEDVINEAIIDSIKEEKALDLNGLIRNLQNKRAKEDGALANPYNLNRKEMISKIMWFKWGAGFIKNESPYIRNAMKKFEKDLDNLSNEELVAILDLFYDEIDLKLAEERASEERAQKLREAREKKRIEREQKLLDSLEEKEESGEAPAETPEAAEEETPAPEPKRVRRLAPGDKTKAGDNLDYLPAGTVVVAGSGTRYVKNEDGTWTASSGKIDGSTPRRVDTLDPANGYEIQEIPGYDKDAPGTGIVESVQLHKPREGDYIQRPDGTWSRIVKLDRTKTKRPSDKAGKKDATVEEFDYTFDDGTGYTVTTTNGSLYLDESRRRLKVVRSADLVEDQAPVAEEAPTTEPTPAEASKPVKTFVRGADLKPGDVLAKDFFTVTNVEGGFTKPIKGKDVPASRVSGYYPGSVEQSSKLWADDTEFEVYRNVEPPAKGDLPELRQPRRGDFANAKDYAEARAKYDEELERRKSTWTPPADAESVEPTPAPVKGPHIVNDIAKNLQPNDIAFVANKDSGEPDEFFVITEVLSGTKEYTRPDNGKVEKKTTVRGYYPGHKEQEVDWNEDTSISVIRGESPDNMPQPGEKDPIERIANGTLKGKEYFDKRAEITAARKEASKGYKPSIKPEVVLKKPYRPDRPAFLGSAAELAKLADGAAISEALKGKRVLIVDFETVGTGKFDYDDPDAPIQLAGAIYENGEKVDEINLLINPGVPLDNYYYENGDKSTGKLDPNKLLTSNGEVVNDEFLSKQPSIKEQLQKFAEWAGPDAIWVAHNAEFDTNTFEKWAQKEGVDFTIGGVIDTKALSRSNGNKKNKLSDLAKKYGVEVDEADLHDASVDIRVLKEVLDKLLLDLKADNKEFNVDLVAEEYAAKKEKYDKDFAAWKAQQEASQVKAKPEIDPSGTDEQPRQYIHKSVFGDEINEAWVLDDDNAYDVNGGGSVLVDELRVGDFIEGRAGLVEVIDLQNDPENPDKLIVYRRSLVDGNVYAERVEPSATPGVGWARGKALEGVVRRRSTFKGLSASEINGVVPKPETEDTTPKTVASEKPVKGEDLSDAQVTSVVSDAIETITSGSKSGKKVKEAIKDLNVDESIKSKVIDREGGSEFHLDVNKNAIKVGDRVRNVKNGRIGTVKAFIGEFGPRKYKNYLKVKFDDAEKRENASSSSLEIINFDDGDGSLAPDLTPKAVQQTSDQPMNMGMALPDMGAEVYEMSPPSEEGSEVPNALPEDNYEYIGEKFPPTAEQRNVITAVMTGDDVVVRALAGTGKTSTLTLAARRLLEESPNKKIVYVAFNKTVQLEAEGKMPKNVESRTGDSIAFQGVSKDIRQKFLNQKSKSATMKLRAEDIADELGIKPTGVKLKGVEVSLSSREIPAIIKQAVNAFSISADDIIGEKHFPQDLDEVPRSFVEYANAYWDDLMSANGVFGINNAHITKIWALSNPDLGAVGSGLKTPADVIFFDEAQDINPVIAKVIADQGIQKVYVGDGNQAIYAFRGAEDQLDKTTAKWDLPLTQSFRFGPEIAGMANRFLAQLDSKYRVEGAGAAGEVVDGMEDPDVVITRTNSGGFRAMIELLDAGKVVGITKGTKDELESLVISAQWLFGDQSKFKKPTMHPDLAEFQNWNEVKEAVEKGEARKVKALYDLVVQNGIGSIKDILNRVKIATSDESKKDLKPSSDFKKITLDQAEDGSKGDIGNGINYEVKETAVRLSGSGTFKGKDTIKDQKFRWDPEGKQWYKEVEDDLDRQKAINDLRRAIGGFAPDAGEEEEEIDVVVTTAHKAKGLQWNNVRIFDDFWGPRVNKKTGELEMPVDEELRLAYVALTRAQKKLDAGPLNWIKEYTEDEDELPKKPTVVEQSMGMALPTENVNEDEFNESTVKTAEKIDPATEQVANAILEALESGVAPWRKPWTGGGFLPTSVATGKSYEGSNILVLWAAMQKNDWTDNRFLTFKQAEKLGGNIKKGEKSTKIIHWQPAFKDVVKDDGTVEKVFIYRPPKVISIFNVEQAENINLPALVKGEPVAVTDAETSILDSYKDRPQVINVAQDQAFYSPIEDIIKLPQREQFKDPKDYFETLVHELAHSTGHRSRLDRTDLLDNYGTHKASRGEEELIAEIAVSIAAARLGVEIDFGNVASYAQSWLGALKNDKSMIVKAAKAAQKAVDYMLGKQEEPAKVDEEGNLIEPVGEGVGSKGRTGEEIAEEAKSAPETTPEPNVGEQGRTGEEIAADTGVASINGEYQKGLPNSGSLRDGMNYQIDMYEDRLTSGRTDGSIYGIRRMTVSGNTFPNREALKNAGFKYQASTKTWTKSYLDKVFKADSLTQDLLDNNPDDFLTSDINNFSEEPSSDERTV
jgi:antirestriction protein ArdC/superfamily I DNA/RNA helicase/DNA polymerase III epsilon subunit-like protein